MAMMAVEGEVGLGERTSVYLCTCHTAAVGGPGVEGGFCGGKRRGEGQDAGDAALARVLPSLCRSTSHRHNHGCGTRSCLPPPPRRRKAG